MGEERDPKHALMNFSAGFFYNSCMPFSKFPVVLISRGKSAPHYYFLTRFMAGFLPYFKAVLLIPDLEKKFCPMSSNS